jgi:peptidoglycan/LPS O-acetylase OafA/YrhL
VVLLFSNFIDPGVSSIFPVWFIQVLVQSMVLFALPFTVRSLRRYANAVPWRFGLIGMSFWVGVALVVPLFWNTDHLYNRMPHLSMWVFIVGWCVHFAQSKNQKLITTLIFLLVTLGVLRSATPSETVWMLGTVVLLWLPNVPIPQIIKIPIQTIGAAAYYIYLTHMIVIHGVEKVAKIESPLLVTVLTLGISTLICVAVQYLQQSLAAPEQWIRRLRRYARLEQ